MSTTTQADTDDINNIKDCVLLLVKKYQSFLQNHRFTLHLAEDIISRFVLYAPTRLHHDDHEDFTTNNGSDNGICAVHHRRFIPETLYALINLWTLINDALYYGVGNDNGLTVGNRYPTTSESASESSSSRTSRDYNYKRKEQIIIILRSILSVSDCIAPALEVRAHYQRNRRRRTNNNDRNSNNPILDTLTHIERIKFICRLAIVLLHYSISYEKYVSTTTTEEEDSRINDNKNVDVSCLSTFGILQDGAIFEFGKSNAISCDSERKRVKRMLYIGKRTGRNINYTRDHHGASIDGNKNDNSGQQHHNQQQENGTYSEIIRQWRMVFESPRIKIGMLVLGEFLHLLRPLFFIHASRFCDRKFGDSNSIDGTNNNKQKRMFMLKIWTKAFLMDVSSQKLIDFATKVDNSHGVVVDISSQSTKDELYHRKMRLLLYLLRSPFFDHVTHPLAQSVGKLLNCIPLVGQPIKLYLLDLLNYWQQWHFMMER